ncbi:MAG: sulfatase-like hydrolase/transferase, partial [bacterium]|nr:sulfatase-like hydrolase/transferase [bacterium]
MSAVRISVLGFMGFAAASLLFSSCAAPQDAPESPRLVVLYAMCTLNKDFLSPYDDTVPYTPNLKALAGRSVVFQRHMTESGQSGISYASLFSGSQAHHHGVYRHPTPLADDLYLISEAYADHGYETFFWNVHRLAGNELNYAQGIPQSNIVRRPLTIRRKRFLKLLDQLQSDSDHRAFVMTNYSTTHALYGTEYLRRFLKRYPGERGDLPEDVVRQCFGKTRPKECNELYSSNAAAFQYDLGRTIERFNLSESELRRISQLEELLYKANVHWLDKLFGDMVKEIERRGLLEESLIVLTTDHGEVLFRENALFHWTHGQALAPEVLNVPWLIYAPGLEDRAGAYEGVTRSIDVFPTMLGLSGLAVPEDRGLEGVDLSEALRGRSPPPELLAFSHTTIPMDGTLESEGYEETFRGTLYPDEEVESIWVSIRKGDRVYKWRHFGNELWRGEVFDLAADPFELRNL